ncbi:hypothetical protein [Planktotalea sp.]|uniref:hypothetical protein n=1 Tax=Planktotalea sp. TaxID=2029877 RepID=UPI003D6B0A15
MFLELIGVIFAGVAMAGVVMLLNRLVGGRIPKWMMPVAAGIAMIGATISNEYSWFERTQAGLPDGVEMVTSFEKKGLMRPWTYVKPYTDKFAALDQLSLREHEAQPDMKLLDLLLFARWSAIQKVPMVFDCANGRQAALIEGAEFSADGQVETAAWFSPPANDPVQKAACAKV